MDALSTAFPRAISKIAPIFSHYWSNGLSSKDRKTLEKRLEMRLPAPPPPDGPDAPLWDGPGDFVRALVDYTDPDQRHLAWDDFRFRHQAREQSSLLIRTQSSTMSLARVLERT